MEKKKKRIDFLDYLKAICVMMVIITHYDWQDKDGFGFAFIINMAVPIFMIISGYNFSMSERKRAGAGLKAMYSKEVIFAKLKRFIEPFLYIGVLEVCLLIIEHKTINLPRIFLLGAYGPGSYYVPIMIQLIFVFPIIYKLVEMDAVSGLLISGLLNLLFEVCTVTFDISKYNYRLCIGRYLLLIAFGAYLYLYPEHRLKKRVMALMMAIGSAFIVQAVMQNTEMKLFDFWTTTAEPVAFYIVPVVVILFRKFYHCHIEGIAGDMLSLIGKASYHIFLVQMVYFHFDLGGALMDANWLIAIPYNMALTITVGILFYIYESKAEKWLDENADEIKYYLKRRLSLN